MILTIDTMYNTCFMDAAAKEIAKVNKFIEGKTFEEVCETFPYVKMNLDVDEGYFDFDTEYLTGSINRNENGLAETGRVWSFYFDGECLFDFEEGSLK